MKVRTPICCTSASLTGEIRHKRFDLVLSYIVETGMHHVAISQCQAEPRHLIRQIDRVLARKSRYAAVSLCMNAVTSNASWNALGGRSVGIDFLTFIRQRPRAVRIRRRLTRIIRGKRSI